MGTDKIVFIRADANASIASGHIMRCLTIAHRLRTLNSQVTFLAADEDTVSMLKSRGEENIICLNSKWDNLDKEMPILLPLLKEHQADVMILDSYYATWEYMKAVKELCKLVYLDDLQAFLYPADLIINYDLDATQDFYGTTPCLLGAGYTPLRSQFQEVYYLFHKEIHNILISTGGSDPHNTAGTILSLCKNYEFYSQSLLHFHVLVGNMNPNKELLLKMSQEDSRIELHENIREMAPLLAECDLAFSAGGTTLFELCAVGVPAISFSISDVQFDCVHAFDHAHMIPYAGDVRQGDTFYQKLMTMGIKIAKDPLYRERTSAKMRSFIDGQGALRIAQAVLAL